jgi:hypothetical protein
MANNFYSNIQARLEQAARASLNPAGILTEKAKKEEAQSSTDLLSGQPTDISNAEYSPEEFDRLKKLEGRFIGIQSANQIWPVHTKHCVQNRSKSKTL